MDLDLERFWAVVRPHRRKPAPKPVPEPRRKSVIWIQAVESGNITCTDRIRVPLRVDKNNNLLCELSFPELDRDVTIVGFRMYIRDNTHEFRYIECAPRVVMLGGSMKLNLSIVDDLSLINQLISIR